MFRTSCEIYEVDSTHSHQKARLIKVLWCICRPHHMAMLKHKCIWTLWRTLLTKWNTDCGNMEGHLKLFSSDHALISFHCHQFLAQVPYFTNDGCVPRSLRAKFIEHSEIGPGQTFSCFCIHSSTQCTCEPVQCSWDVSNSVATGRCSWLLLRRQHPRCSQIEALL